MRAYKQRIFGLDVIRAIAILLVLFSHSSLLLFPESDSFITRTIQFFGTIGVDIFFVLSGFLIGTILIKQIEFDKVKLNNIIYFWVRRWFRTLPNYFLILIVNIALFYLMYGDSSERIGSYFFFFQNFNQVQPDFFTESWSLSIEEFAYLIGPILLIIIGVFFKRITKYTFLVITLVVIVIGVINRYNFHVDMIYTVIDDISWSKSLRKVVIYRIDSIYYGFLGAYFAYYFSVHWNKYRNICAVLGAFLFLSVHAYIVIEKLEPSVQSFFFNNLYLTLIALSILMFFPIISTWKKGKYFRALITNISIWSYSLYLINYSIIFLTIQYFIDIRKLNLLSMVMVLLMYWVLTFFFSYLLYSKFEKPMMKLRDNKLIIKMFS